MIEDSIFIYVSFGYFDGRELEIIGIGLVIYLQLMEIIDILFIITLIFLFILIFNDLYFN